MDTKRLRQRVLDLAIHGKLVPQNPQDESASELLKRIAKEKERLVKEGKIKKSKKKANEDIDEVPFEVPQGWVWCRLEDICTIKGGKRIPVGYTFSDSITNHIYIRVSDMKRGTICLDDLHYISDEVYEKIKQYYITKDDIYMTIVGATIGKCGLIPNELDHQNLSENAARIIPHILQKEYLLHCLTANFCQEQFIGKLHHVGVQKMALSRFVTTLIPLPPLAEQHRIVSEVEKYFSLIDILEESENDLQQSIQKAKSKILDLAIKGKLVEQNEEDESASVLLERIKEENNRNEKKSKIKDTKINEVPFEVPQGWVWTNIKILCSKIVDGDHNPPKGTKTATNYRMLSSKNIANNQIEDIDDCRYLTYEDWELCNSRTQLSKGDILLTTVATLGRSCVVEKEYPFCFQRSVTVISTYIYNYYLKYFFDSPYFQEYMRDNAKGTAQKGFYLNQFENSPIPLPPLAEQHRIVAKIEELFTQLDNIAEALK